MSFVGLNPVYKVLSKKPLQPAGSTFVSNAKETVLEISPTEIICRNLGFHNVTELFQGIRFRWMKIVWNPAGDPMRTIPQPCPPPPTGHVYSVRGSGDEGRVITTRRVGIIFIVASRSTDAKGQVFITLPVKPP
jgi:hypothetical protein